MELKPLARLGVIQGARFGVPGNVGERKGLQIGLATIGVQHLADHAVGTLGDAQHVVEQGAPGGLLVGAGDKARLHAGNHLDHCFLLQQGLLHLTQTGGLGSR